MVLDINEQPNINIDTTLGRLVQKLSEEFKYPYSIEDGKNYKYSINKNVRKFIKIIKQFNGDSEFVLQLKNNMQYYLRLGNNLQNVITKYLQGKPYDAYRLLNEIITTGFIEKYWNGLKIQARFTENNFLYRVRESTSHLRFLEDIFHIPFDKVHMVKAQRYSIAGVPCLYLGSSLYVCWLEMGRPDLNKLFLSSFIPSEFISLNLLDLSNSFTPLIAKSNRISTNNSFTINYIESIIATWPVTQTCSFKRYHQNANFNIEYILPNLILQWVKDNHEIDGVRYLSTHFDFKSVHKYGYNYVFPPKKIEGNFCPHLCKKFKFTEPASWQILQAINNNGFFSELIETDEHVDSFDQQLLIEYINTSFGHTENILSKDPTKFKNLNNV